MRRLKQRLLVVPEMVLSAEGFVAHIARERALVGVRPLVNQQIVRLGELALAVPADELLLRSARASRASAVARQGEPKSISLGKGMHKAHVILSEMKSDTYHGC